MFPFLKRTVLKVSLVDSDTGQPLGEKGNEQDRSSLRGSVTHTDVTKDRKGQLVLVQHREKPAGAGNGGSGGGQGTFQDVKKDTGATNGNGSNGGKGDGKTNGAVDDNELNFTPEEDAKLLRMKEEKPSGPWAEVGEALDRPVWQVKQRFGELKKPAKAPSGDTKGDTKQDQPKQNGVQQNDSKKHSGDGAKPQEGDWTAAEDAIIREGIANKEAGGVIAAKLDGRVKKEVNKRMGQLKAQDNGNTKNEGDNKDKVDQQAQACVGEAQNNGGNKKDKRNKNKNNQNENQQAAKQENAPKKEEPKPKAPASKAGSSRSEAKFTMGEWMTLQEDDMFSFRELQLLSELIMMDAKGSWDGVYSWLRVASLFADRTGRRVHPEDIREKFEAMARD